MNPKKQNRRKTTANKLEPIDWHEFANDAVLNGNMSTLYRRPPSEDPSAYASAEALIEIEKRIARPLQDSVTNGAREASNNPEIPTVGFTDTVGSEPPASTMGTIPRVSQAVTTTPTVGPLPPAGIAKLIEDAPVIPAPTVGITPTVGFKPTAALKPTVGLKPADAFQPTDGVPTTAPENIPTVGSIPRRSAGPTEGFVPTVGPKPKAKIKPVRDVPDALTLAGQILYRAMFGSPDGSSRSICTKGYRQLAAETRLDKDTVRDLIVEFKQKGMVRETATYDPDTRLAKTYEVLASDIILQLWREAGLHFVTAGRQRPQFCTLQGELIIPTVGP